MGISRRVSRRFAHVGLVMIALAPGIAAAQASQPAPFCPDALPPTIDPAFANVQSFLPNSVGTPVECAHQILSGDVLIQHLSNGVLVLPAATGSPTLVDGSQFFTVQADGTVVTSAVAPDGVLRALLVPDQPASPSVEVAGLQVGVTGTPAATAPTPKPTSTPRDVGLYRQDPRFIAPDLADLPDGGAHAWVPIGDDTTHLLDYRYTVTYGKHPRNGAPLPLDPLLIVDIFASESIEQAQSAWASTYGKLAAGERAGSVLAPFADDQFYALAPGVIDVRARYHNILVHVVQATNGVNEVSLDDTVGLVRIILNRVLRILS